MECWWGTVVWLPWGHKAHARNSCTSLPLYVGGPSHYGLLSGMGNFLLFWTFPIRVHVDPSQDDDQDDVLIASH